MWVVIHAAVLWAFLLLASIARGQEQVRPADAGGDAAIGGAGTAGGAVDSFPGPVMTGQPLPLYRLATSDVLEIGFTFAPEFNQTVTVQPDGFIPLKGAASLYVKTLTIPELKEALQKAYAGVLHEPEITLALRDFEKPYFIAGGEVARPGKYDLRSETTVTEAMAIAGGMTRQARHSQVVLFRKRANDMFEARVLNLKAMLHSRNLDEDVRLRPGDLLYVPQNTISKIARFIPASNLGMYWNARPN